MSIRYEHCLVPHDKYDVFKETHLTRAKAQLFRRNFIIVFDLLTKEKQ